MQLLNNTMRLSKQQLIFGIAVIAISILVSLAVVGANRLWSKSRYVAVRLQTGELYFGKISWFPSPKLSDVWLINVGQDGQVSIDRFQNLLWQPQGTMRIRRDKIVFWAYLTPASPIVQAIEGRIQPQQQTQLPFATPLPVSPSP